MRQKKRGTGAAGVGGAAGVRGGAGGRGRGGADKVALLVGSACLQFGIFLFVQSEAPPQWKAFPLPLCRAIRALCWRHHAKGRVTGGPTSEKICVRCTRRDIEEFEKVEGQ